MDVVSRMAPFPITTIRKGRFDEWKSSKISCAEDAVVLSLVVASDDASWNVVGLLLLLPATALVASTLGGLT